MSNIQFMFNWFYPVFQCWERYSIFCS